MELKRPSLTLLALSRRSLTHLDQILCMARDRFQVLYCEKFPLLLTKVTVPNELGPARCCCHYGGERKRRRVQVMSRFSSQRRQHPPKCYIYTAPSLTLCSGGGMYNNGGAAHSFALVLCGDEIFTRLLERENARVLNIIRPQWRSRSKMPFKQIGIWHATWAKWKGVSTKALVAWWFKMLLH